MGDLPSTSIDFPFSRETLRQLLSTFREAESPSVNFSEHSVRLGDLPSPTINFL